MPSASSRRRFTAAIVASIATMAAAAGPAAASRAGAAAGCPDAPLSNPFTQWSDGADYQLAPQGDVEAADSSWSVSGGAGAIEGNESFMVTSPSDHRSMQLPGSSTATTASMCITVDHPTFRFFVKRSGGSALSRLLVEVTFDDANGRSRSLPVGLILGSSSWAPSPILRTVVNVLAPINGNAIQVAFRFTPVGDAAWSVDDLYVDPSRGI